MDGGVHPPHKEPFCGWCLVIGHKTLDCPHLVCDEPYSFSSLDRMLAFLAARQAALAEIQAHRP